MVALTIRNVDPDLKERLRVQAARHGRSMEAEVRQILRKGLEGEPHAASGLSFSQRIQARFAGLSEGELELPPREPARDPPSFD